MPTAHTVQHLDQAVPLAWGRRYVMVRPDHFRVDYAINPYMDPADQPDARLAMAQWVDLVSTIERVGGSVEVVPQRDDAPDMVYAMNLGFAVVRPEADSRGHVVMSHMRFAQRRMETGSARPWFEGSGRTTAYVGRDGVGAHLEAGDVFAWGDALVAGFGPRTEELALKHLATELDVRVRGLRITHPSMYHLDLAFCPLDDRRAMVAPGAFDGPSAEALLDLVPEPLVLSDDEALSTFCANSIVVGRTVVMPAGSPDRVKGLLADGGFEVVEVDVSQFHKAGGSVRCLTNPVDLTLGRDVPTFAGGEVVLPPTA
ncbi:MAG: arginine deiminase family protein [Nocardioides sp.]